MIFNAVLIIIVLYILLVFVGLRLVVPFFGFRQYQPPTDLPPEIRQAIAQLENKSTDQMSYLREVYNLILDKTLHQWKHTRFKAARRLPRAFVSDLAGNLVNKDFVY